MDPGLDGPERDPGHLGDLSVVVALDVVQDDRGALVVGDPSQRPGQRPRSLREQRRALRVRLVAGRWLPALVVEFRIGLDRPSLPGALRVHRRVDADPVEPRLDASATERGQVAERREERLLDAVGRLVAIRDHPHDEREQVVLVEHDEVVECIEIAVSGSLEQDEVAALDGVIGDRRRAKVLHGRWIPPDGDSEAGRV